MSRKLFLSKPDEAFQHFLKINQSQQTELQCIFIIKLEALGQCIPPPRHVLPVLRYGLDHHQKLTICSLAHYQPSLRIPCKSV